MIIGIDLATFDLMGPWMEAGEPQNLARSLTPGGSDMESPDGSDG